MLDIDLGDPRGALVFLLVMLGLGLVLGVVIFVVVAFPWARRPRFRNFDAMPRIGAMCGLGVALLFAYIAWNTASGDFHRIEIREGKARLHYLTPSRSCEIPVALIVGVRRDETMAKWDRWRILLETDQGVLSSTTMSRHQMEEVWRTLADFVKPLP